MLQRFQGSRDGGEPLRNGARLHYQNWMTLVPAIGSGRPQTLSKKWARNTYLHSLLMSCLPSRTPLLARLLDPWGHGDGFQAGRCALETVG